MECLPANGDEQSLKSPSIFEGKVKLSIVTVPRGNQPDQLSAAALRPLLPTTPPNEPSAGRPGTATLLICTELSPLRKLYALTDDELYYHAQFPREVSQMEVLGDQYDGEQCEITFVINDESCLQSK